MTTVAAPRRAPALTHAEQVSEFEKLISETYAQLPTIPTWCTRCDKPAHLPFGPGADICPACMAAEYADRKIGRRTR